MTAPGAPMPPDLDRLLAGATVPAMSAGLIDRIVAEAERPGRVVLPVARPSRSRGRQWTRRGVWSGIVAVNLMLATAVAAAFGGGALTFAKIATVAQHVVAHLRAPFRPHPEPRIAAAPRPVVHRMTVPAAAILTAPRVVLPMTAARHAAGPMTAARDAAGPMTAARSVVARPIVARPVPPHGLPVTFHAPRTAAIERGGAVVRPHLAAHVEPHLRAHEPLRHVGTRRDEAVAAHPVRAPREARALSAGPIAPRADTSAAAESAHRDSAVGERGLQAEGGARFDTARGQAPATAGADGRIDDRAGLQAQDRSPGWRRRMLANNPGAGMPGWRRRAGLNGPGPGRPGGRMKPFRPGGGGRHPRRF